MNATPTFKSLFDSSRGSLSYKVEGLIIDFTEQLCARLEGLGLSKVDLAERMHTSPAYVSKLFSGGTNFTLESMAKLTEALDADVRIDVVPKVSIEDWIEVMEKSGPSEKVKILSLWSRHQSEKVDEGKSLVDFRRWELEFQTDNFQLDKVA